jgi:hypothetical protein
MEDAARLTAQGEGGGGAERDIARLPAEAGLQPSDVIRDEPLCLGERGAGGEGEHRQAGNAVHLRISRRARLLRSTGTASCRPAASTWICSGPRFRANRIDGI